MAHQATVFVESALPLAEDARIEAFGRALEALRSEVERQLGVEDGDYAQGIDRMSRRLELIGRGLIYLSFEPLAFSAGTLALLGHKLLELAEIGHMALHGAYDGLPGAGRLQSDDFRWKAPIDEASWKSAHNHRHHQYTNTVGKDPDLDFAALRLSARTPYRTVHRLQPITNLLSWLGFSTAIHMHVTGLLELYFGREPKRRELRSKASVRRVFLRKWLRYYGKELGLYPLLAGPFAAKVFLANLITELARDVWIGAIIYCGHVGARDFAADTIPASRAHWYAMQAEAARDIEMPHLLSVLSGALDRQIEHHLFPRMPPNRLRQIAPRVRAICEAHGVEYRSEGWARALRGVLRELRRISAPVAEAA